MTTPTHSAGEKVGRASDRVIGLSCWQREGNGGCRASFDITLRKGEHACGRNGQGYDRLHLEAGRVGWVIGHVDGQGHYACPDCAPSLYDPIRLNISERATDATAEGRTP